MGKMGTNEVPFGRKKPSRFVYIYRHVERKRATKNDGDPIFMNTSTIVIGKKARGGPPYVVAHAIVGSV
jgi:hypothetical protein